MESEQKQQDGKQQTAERDEALDDTEVACKQQIERNYKMKEDILANFTTANEKQPSVHSLNMEKTFIDSGKKLAKVEFGQAKDDKTNKVIMVVGATGAGKSTLINGFVNYILGVDWKDEFRFQLIPDDSEGNQRKQAESQTKWITSYTLHHREGFKIDYTFTLIDTPGFGDTSGIMRDKEITEQIRTFFTSGGRKKEKEKQGKTGENGENGIDHIDAIGFVTQASLARLTPTQQYIFDSILALFGKDIADNIFLLTTFADGKKPPVVAAIKKAGIPFNKILKFNNSALYAGFEGNQESLEREEDSSNSCSSDEDEEDFAEMFWNMGVKSFTTFFTLLFKTESKSLILTKDVLKERQRLETYVPNIHKQIRMGLTKLEELRIEATVLKKCETDIEQSKNFQYEVTEERTVRIQNPLSTYVTNCLTCNFTCHYPCGIPMDKDKKGCIAMGFWGKCTMCPSRCDWNLHVNVPYRLEIKKEKKIKTVAELETRYREASGEKMTKQKLIQEVMKDFEKVQLQVLFYTNEIRKSLDRLKEIALKPNPLSTVQYIDTLIETEKSNQESGYQDRLAQLSEVRKHAEHLQQMATPNYDPFEKYSKIYEEMLQKKGNEESFFAKMKRFIFS